MLQYPRSLWIAAALVAVTHVGVLFLAHGSGTTETQIPQRPLDDLPNRLGDWEGRPVDPDAQIFQRLGAHSVVNRAYRDPLGHEVVLHVAMWSSDGLQLPHEPRMCYQGAGFEILSTKDFPLGEGDPSQSTGHLMALQRGSERCHALFWYQWGPWTVADRNDMRQALWRMRGQHPWPPLIKVLMQVGEPKADKAEEELRGLSQALLPWLREYHD